MRCNGVHTWWNICTQASIQKTILSQPQETGRDNKRLGVFLWKRKESFSEFLQIVGRRIPACTKESIHKTYSWKQLGKLCWHSPEICTMVQSFALECEMNKHLRAWNLAIKQQWWGGPCWAQLGDAKTKGDHQSPSHTQDWSCKSRNKSTLCEDKRRQESLK